MIRDHQEGMSRLRAQVAEMRRTLERMKAQARDFREPPNGCDRGRLLDDVGVSDERGRAPPPNPPGTTRVLPILLRIGDWLTDKTGDYEVIGRAYTTNAGTWHRIMTNNPVAWAEDSWSPTDAFKNESQCRSMAAIAALAAMSSDASAITGECAPSRHSFGSPLFAAQ